MSETENKGPESSSARGADNSAIQPTINKGGRPRKDQYTRGVQDILNGTASDAALILRKLIERKRGHKHLRADLQRACEYVIDHAIGKARQKVEHSGGVLTYGDLLKSAEALEKKPRPILSVVEEIAHKYQEKTPPPTPPEPAPEPGK